MDRDPQPGDEPGRAGGTDHGGHGGGVPGVETPGGGGDDGAGLDVSIKLNLNSILTYQRPIPDVRLGAYANPTPASGSLERSGDPGAFFVLMGERASPNQPGPPPRTGRVGGSRRAP